MFLAYDMHAKAVNCGHLYMACDMHVQIIGPDVLGFPNFTTLVKNYKLGFNDYKNPQYGPLVVSGPIRSFIKVSWAQNSFWACIVTPYNFGLLAQSKS